MKQLEQCERETWEFDVWEQAYTANDTLYDSFKNIQNAPLTLFCATNNSFNSPA